MLATVISIITLLCFVLFAFLQINKTINFGTNTLVLYLPVISGLIVHLVNQVINQIDKNKGIKPKVKIKDAVFLNQVQTSPENSTISINVANTGKSTAYLKRLIVLSEHPHKYLPFIKKRVTKKIIGRGVSLKPNTPIEPNSDTSFYFTLAYLYDEDCEFVKFGVETSTGEIFWINKRDFNKTIRKHKTQYDNTINTTFKTLYQKCPDTDIETDIVEKLKSMADSSWDATIIFEKTKQIFDSYQIYDIQWIGAIRDINSIEVKKLRQFHLHNSFYIKDIYTKLDQNISSLFQSVVLRTYNELRENNIITIDVSEDQILNELDIPYKKKHGDYESIFDELTFYLKPDEHLSDKQSGLWLTFGTILSQQLYFPSAVKCFEKSIELGNDIALLHLAITLNIYYDTIDEIVSLCTRYMDKKPDDYMGYYVLARAYLKQCKRNEDDTYLSKCSENIDKALKKSLDKPEVYRLSSEYYTLIGKNELAEKQRKKAQDLENAEKIKSGSSD